MAARDLTKVLLEWLTSGGEQIGQVVIRRCGDAWELRHIEDRARDDLQLFTRAEDARALANLDDAGIFRPLKTATNLAHGWRLLLENGAELRRALDFFYPAMLGVWFDFRHGEVRAVPLRETLGRQSGMYRVTQKITDEQADELIASFCSGCLKQRLWEIATPAQVPPIASPGELPLLCHEACNLLIAEARKVVKAAPAP